jgi:hypothetical protein
MEVIKTKKKLHGLSPRANYTDRATAACQRSDCQLKTKSKPEIMNRLNAKLVQGSSKTQKVELGIENFAQDGA